MEYMIYEEWLKYKQIEFTEHDSEEVKEYTKIMYLEDEIKFYKDLLNKTDFKAIKYSEGYYTEEEYEPIKKERESYREKIRELEKELEEQVI